MSNTSFEYQENQEYDKISRYTVLRKIVENSDEIRAYLETQNQRFVEESESDAYHIVKDTEVNRLDIIANKYYGDPSLWWVIALANNYIDPFIVNQDDLIRIPSVHTLYKTSQRILVV